MSIIAELDASLQALRSLKAPGVTKSRISSITTLCVENVESESVLVQKIFTQFKKTPGSHKLGVLYVVDSVTRQWIDKATAAGQELVGSSAPDGTFAAGVNRITSLLPSMLNDLVQTAPDDQKEKIIKLIDIWERGNVFPLATLVDYKNKVNARPSQQTETHQSAPSTDNSAADLLAKLQSANVASSQTNTTSHIPLAGTVAGPPPVTANIPNGSQMSHGAAPAPVIPMLAGLPPDQAQMLSAIIPAHIATDNEKVAQYLQLLQQLVTMGVPPDQWPLVIAALQDQVSSGQVAPQSQGSTLPNMAPLGSAPHARDRSRSPGRRGTPVQDRYRDRTDLRNDSPDLRASRGNKWTDVDTSIPEGHIKVLSRTLFVGGATCGEHELRQVFQNFGEVQTVIVNPEKRHAFVKMANRAGALTAKDGMERNPPPQASGKVRSTRWGVGFGPRDCSDYQTGISIIPMERLTEADRKWVLTAEYGGTGGKAMTSGMVMEEPDIEIGAGVSSKAISRRVNAPESGGRRGNFNNNNNTSNNGNNNNNNRDNQNRNERRNDYKTNSPRPSNATVQNYDANTAAAFQGFPNYGYQAPPPGSYGAPPPGGQMPGYPQNPPSYY